MSPDTPREAVEESADRFGRLETLVRRTSRIEGRVDAVEDQVETAGDSISDETRESIAELCANIRSNAVTMRTDASEFLDTEADFRALISMTSVLTSDLSEVAEHAPGDSDLGQEVEPFASAYDDVCDTLEREITLLQAVIAHELDHGEPSVDEDEVEMTPSELLSKLKEIQAERGSVSERQDDQSGPAAFELTETAFFN
ncbi:hypothetical protein [Halorubellus sp. PRR65]|uniref:hypothetical protein n=1 Tax=Halorubellus sp. PRR65 TaxID=3098148 RepID=UPI002B25D704|nr:hypothetical protein [Halorubellus sp. PRR65]